MENERPIEKLLRRFAKERRQESDAPREMHPATRRLLQGEVTRQFAKSRAGDQSSTSKFSRLWAKLAVGVCTVAVVAVVGAMFLPALNRAKSSVQLAKTYDAGQLEGDESLGRKELATPASASAPTESVDRLDAPGLEESELTFAKVAQSPASPQRSSTEAAVTLVGGIDSSGERKREFADRDNLDASRQKQDVAMFSNVGSLQTRLAVLNSFRVEQVGDELRVTDEDGSTYGGNIVTDTRAQSAPQTVAPVGGSYALGESQQFTKDKKVSNGLSLGQSSQNLFFRVSGTNRTLQQQVVFEGNIISTNEARQNQAPAQSVQQFQNFQFFINNSVIVGKAQVEQGAEIKINAAPVSP